MELEVMPDHVHLLVEVDPQYGIHRLIRDDQRAFVAALAPGVSLA